VRHGVTADRIIGVSHEIGRARFAAAIGLLALDSFSFVALGDARPLRGPKLGVFAREILQDRLEVVLLGAAENVPLARALADHRLDLLQVLDPAHGPHTAILSR
jgi:hypothetical protein